MKPQIMRPPIVAVATKSYGATLQTWRRYAAAWAEKDQIRTRLARERSLDSGCSGDPDDKEATS